MVVTKSGLSERDSTPPFFAFIATERLKDAYALLCPSIRGSIDYRAFGTTLNANPFVRFNAGFTSHRSRTLIGSGAKTLSGWMASFSGIVPAELELGTDANQPCVLGGTVAGSSLLPPFGLAGPAAPLVTAYLAGDALRDLLTHAYLDLVPTAGPRMRIEFTSATTRTLSLTMPDGQTLEDVGTYSIEENRICGTWKKTNASQETCVRYLMRDDGGIEVYDVNESFLQSRGTRHAIR